MNHPRLLVAAVLAAACVGGVVVAATGSADASAKNRTVRVETTGAASGGTIGAVRYVALGDSYTSAPGVPPFASDAPPGCGRSAVNYPHLLAASLGAQLLDVSCGGARTKDLDEAQSRAAGPQFDALSRDTTLVTIGIGGNNHNLFATAIAGCTATALNVLAGSVAPCRDRFGDSFEDDIADTGASVRAALKQIRTRAPNAEIVLVGYPAIFPSSTVGQVACVAAGVPLTPGDIEYLDGIERSLNAALEAAADATSTTFLDTYTPSVGHDLCQLPGVRWIEPLIPISPAAPVHPNAAGQAAVARILTALVSPAN